MKILILTQPLGHNYGGLLQAYALQRYLSKSGHQVVTLDRRRPIDMLEKLKTLNLRKIKKRLKKRLKKRDANAGQPEKPAPDLKKIEAFRDKKLVMSPCIESNHQLHQYCKDENFDAYVVGSDQVWRALYSPHLPNFYLDFLDKINSSAKRVSYAASFGTDHWECEFDETWRYKRLIHKFDALSVRETAAITLCEKYYDVTPQWVMDPTFLLDAQDYQEISTQTDERQITAFLLDPSEEKNKLCAEVSKTLGQELFFFEPDKNNQCPKVEVWLHAFANTRFIITDSYHGCIFAIIFNKPFLAIGNKERGLARFQSLLALFNLEDRLITSWAEIDTSLLTQNIDWDSVNKIKQEKAAESKKFLNDSLSGIDDLAA